MYLDECSICGDEFLPQSDGDTICSRCTCEIADAPVRDDLINISLGRWASETGRFALRSTGRVDRDLGAQLALTDRDAPATWFAPRGERVIATVYSVTAAQTIINEIRAGRRNGF